MFRYTGHPFVDVGVATLVAYAGVSKPDQLTERHVDDFTTRIVDWYMNPMMAGYLSYVVFANARFANPAQINNPKFDDQRRASLSELLNLWRWQPGNPLPAKEEPADEGELCVFSGDPAVIRASRVLIPMTTDETNINFVPEGRPKLPIAGWCVLALLAMPLGSLNSNGKLWLVHSTDPQTLQHFAAINLDRNRKAFQMSGLEKLPNYRFARTHLIKDLIITQESQHYFVRNAPLTAYLFTSSGQKSEVEIVHLPSNIIEFVTYAIRHYEPAWIAIEKRAWALQDKEAEVEDGKLAYSDRNYFYEDLFELPYGAGKFLRTYLLRRRLAGKPSGKQKADPRYEYSFIKDREAISWELTEYFLEKVMNMDKERIEAIRNLGDRLADYIQRHDSRLFKKLFLARNDYQLRLELLRAANSATGQLLPYDEFITVFFIDDGETAKPDWYFARDLLMVRIIEGLHQTDWIESHKDVVDDVDATLNDAEA